MADTPGSSSSKPPGSTTSSSSSGQFGFLTHKLFGKIPVWVVALALVAGYYWYEHYGPGAKKAAAATAARRPRARAERPRIIVVRGGGDGGDRRHHHDRRGGAGPMRGATGQAPDQASMAAAPGTSGAVYGGSPTAAMDGSVYGGDGAQAPQVYVPEQSYAAAQPEGTYVPADTSELDGPYVPAG